MSRSKRAGWLMAAAMLAGCSSTGPLARRDAAGPVGPSFVSGKGVQMFAASPNVITDVKDAMTDVGIHSIHQIREPDNTDVLEGTTADNRRAHVAIQPRGTRMAVTTKVGWRGDEALSRAILDRISIRQGKLPASAMPVEPAPVAASEPEPAAEARDPSAGGVSDEVMLRNQLESGFNTSPVP